jgi:hypothetical protein
MAIIIVVVLVIALLGIAWFWILPWLWQPDTEPDLRQDECRPGGSELSKEYEASESGVVRVIRLTDDGEFVDRCELTDAIYEIRNCQKPELIVWYIHGWKHNADKEDSDRKNFESLIKELAKKQSEEGGRRRVVGIYIGWDGAVGPALLRNLSFWNRKGAADRISQSAVLSKIFAATKYARRQQEKEITAKDLTIMIGHSFGARILYTATSQVLIEEVQRRHPGRAESSYGVIEGPADLILLLNPALQAAVFTAMHSVRRRDSHWWESIDAQQQALLLAISSENDWATGKAFPLGQWLAFARRDRQRQTLGNYREYITHSLQALQSTDRSAAISKFWYDHFEANCLLLRRTAMSHPGNPFMVARTTPDIIDGHNGIWGESLRNWMIEFMLELHKRASLSESRRHRSG